MIFRFIPYYINFRAYNRYNSIIVIAPNKEEAICYVTDRFSDDHEDQRPFKEARIEEIVDDGNLTEIICEDYTTFPGFLIHLDQQSSGNKKPASAPLADLIYPAPLFLIF